MRPEKFPKRKPDGSFCIELTLGVGTRDTAELASRMTAWIEEWVRANRYWKTVLADRVGGVFDFYDEFVRPPYCVTRYSGSLLLRLEGRPGAGKWWKDWILSRLIMDLRVAFKEIQHYPVEGIRNCQEDDNSA
jgi:hypothetical protein